MASTNMKRIVGDSIAGFFSTAIPSLNGNIKTGQDGPETNFSPPAVRMYFETLTFSPENVQEEYWTDPDDGKVIYDVGEWDGLLRIELWCSTKPERETFEQLIIDQFLSFDAWSPGTVSILTPNLTINGYISLYAAQIKIWLDQQEWQEEMAFEGHRYTFITVPVSFPALTSANAVTIQELDVIVSTDFEAVITDSGTVSKTDKITVQLDGTTTQAP
jgi:hypothetical protein